MLSIAITARRSPKPSDDEFRRAMGKQSCLNIVSHISPQFGGVATSLPPFCEAMEAGGRYRSPLVAFCADGEDASSANGKTFVFRSLPLVRRQRAFHLEWKEQFEAMVAEASSVHIHGIWQDHCSLGIAQGRSSKKPVVISAHGMLDRWALDNKRWKKTIYLALRHRKELQRVDCLRALTRAEAQDYRRVGLRAPVAIIPNGVVPPPAVTSNPFLDRFPALRNRRLILFLGRIHYKKGINLLADAWSRVCTGFPDAQLVFAGPDSENSQRALLKRIETLGIASRVTFTGSLTGVLKWSALAAAHTFVLPSHSEGFSIAALEAMAVGRPVILSKECHFEEVDSLGCGWVIEPHITALEAAIAECLSADNLRLTEIGESGRRLARTRYTWANVANQMADVCDWLDGGATPPTTELIFD